MDDLMALSDKQILNAMSSKADNFYTENLSVVGNRNNMPLRGDGSIISANPYKTLKNGMSKDIDLMIGSNGDELRYWVEVMQQDSLEKNIAVYNEYIKYNIISFI